MYKESKCVIVFSGFNQRAVIAFLRTLEKNKVKYAVIAKSKEDDIFLTEYKDKVLAIRNSVPLDLEDMINSIEKVKVIHKDEEFIIAPSTEALNRFLLDNKEHFDRINCKIPLVDQKKYILISDKYSFGLECKEHQILVPCELKIDEINKFPIVAKPKEYFSEKREILSPVIIKSMDEFIHFKKNSSIDDFYFQEFVEGESLYLLYYFYKDGKVKKFSQENIVQQPGGKSMVAAISSNFHNSTESEKYEALFLSLKYTGLVMVEVKRHGDKNYMIEANPRFWGPSQLFVDAGVNLFESFLEDLGLIEKKKSDNEVRFNSTTCTRYFWFGGLTKTLQKNGELVFHKGKKEIFMDDLPKWLEIDVYRRSDTLEIFEREFSL